MYDFKVEGIEKMFYKENGKFERYCVTIAVDLRLSGRGQTTLTSGMKTIFFKIPFNKTRSSIFGNMPLHQKKKFC